jgi:hypothetical protein
MRLHLHQLLCKKTIILKLDLSLLAYTDTITQDCDNNLVRGYTSAGYLNSNSNPDSVCIALDIARPRSVVL